MEIYFFIGMNKEKKIAQETNIQLFNLYFHQARLGSKFLRVKGDVHIQFLFVEVQVLDELSVFFDVKEFQLSKMKESAGDDEVLAEVVWQAERIGSPIFVSDCDAGDARCVFFHETRQSQQEIPFMFWDLRWAELHVESATVLFVELNHLDRFVAHIAEVEVIHLKSHAD